MAAKTTKLGFDNLIIKVKIKVLVSNVWFVMLNLKDFELLLWKETKKDPASLGILLTTISVCIVKVIRSQPTYKLLECEAIKGALNVGVFGVLPKADVYYLPHPEVATKVSAPATTVFESELDEDDDGIAEDIHQSKQHEAEHWAAAKKSMAKDKGKAIVPTAEEETGQPFSSTTREAFWF
ncbi:hypothetical protein R1sor_001987 [Riccia sorocarpa]|uniref:Uncharacterized protein n=1 Tax=Riccia sorocarpa TaxID=122646 RepID=A0ABD3H0V7_9MARC